jgi:hypothetical protein
MSYHPADGTRFQRLLFISLIPSPAKKRFLSESLAFLVILGLGVIAMLVL